MRRTSPAGLLVLALLLGACDPPPSPAADTGERDASLPDAATPIDAPTCAPSDCPEYRCGPTGVPQISNGTCGPCAYVDLPSLCRICRPGVASSRITDVCPPPVPRGAACASDADCIPSAPDTDRHGLTHATSLTCDATGHCDGPAWVDEICANTIDDDADGTTDEGCACTPRTFTVSPLPVPDSGALVGAIAGPHILVAGPSSGDVYSGLGPLRITLADTEGHVLSDEMIPTPTAGYPTIDCAATREGDVGYVLLSPASAATHRVVRIAPDGTQPSLERELGFVAAPQVVDWGNGDLAALWTAPGAGSPTHRTSYGGTPLAFHGEDIVSLPIGAVAIAPLDDGTHLAVVATYTHPELSVLSERGARTTLPPLPEGTSSLVRDIARTTDRLWIVLHDAHDVPVLFALDPATGALRETVPLEGALPWVEDAFASGPHAPSPRLAAHGDVLFVAFDGPEPALHVLAVSTTGTILGSASLPTEGAIGAAPADRQIILGTTDDGLRIVHHGVGWNLAAPCDAL